MAMFSPEDLAQREQQEVELDGQGISEAYFPLWGVSNVEDYLQKSDELRRGAAAEQALGGAEAEGEAGADAADDSLAREPGQPVVRQEEGLSVLAGTRVAWGAWFWVKRIAFALVVCVVGSLLITMALNPSMTFFEAAKTLLGGLLNLVEGSWPEGV